MCSSIIPFLGPSARLDGACPHRQLNVERVEAVPGIIESYLRPFQACDSTNNLICNEAMDENIFFWSTHVQTWIWMPRYVQIQRKLRLILSRKWNILLSGSQRSFHTENQSLSHVIWICCPSSNVFPSIMVNLCWSGNWSLWTSPSWDLTFCYVLPQCNRLLWWWTKV